MLEIIICGRKKVQIANIYLIHSILGALYETLKKYWALKISWDFSMRMAMTKIRPNGFERRESFEDMWEDIYRIDECFEGCLYGYWMLEVDWKLIDTSGWLNYAFLHREEFTSRWHPEFCPYPKHPTVDWFNRWPLVNLPSITDLIKATIFFFISTQIYSE